MSTLTTDPIAAGEIDALSASVSTPAQLRAGGLKSSVLRNTAAQGGGRIVIALSRLMIAGLIVRSYGRVTFGEYALVFSVLSIAEWLMDFGVTEVFVREICREPARAPRLMRIMTAAKLIQAPAAYLLLAVALLVLRYSAAIVQASLIGGAAMLFYGGVLIYRVVFRAGLHMEREVTAELISVIAMVPMIALASRMGFGLSALLACHVISRAIFFALSLAFGRRSYRISIAGVTLEELRWALKASAAIGAIGLLVGVYEALDVLLISKLCTLSEVAYYSAGQRLVWPTLMALASVGATLYPVASSFWPDSREAFENACQRGLNTVVVLAGLALCPMLPGATFFLGLIGRDLQVGAPALRVLAVLCFIKSITSTLGPLLYVVHAQKSALQFIAVATVVKATAVALVAPRWGYMSVAWSAVVVELMFAVVPTVWLLQRFTGWRIGWGVVLKVPASMAIAAGAAWWMAQQNALAGAVIAPLLFVPLAFLTGAVQTNDLRQLAARGTAS
jgi:O-antigen/teichoic acid export membrane protein